MENFLRDNVGVFGFGRPPPLDISDPADPLLGRLPLPISLSDPNDPIFIPKGGYQMTQSKPMEPNMLLTQLNAPIPPNNQPTIAQSLVHTTPQQPIILSTIVATTSPFTSIPFNVIGSFTSQSVAFILNIPTSSGSDTSQSNIQSTSQSILGMPLVGPTNPPFTSSNLFAFMPNTTTPYPLSPSGFGQVQGVTKIFPFSTCRNLP